MSDASIDFAHARDVDGSAAHVFTAALLDEVTIAGPDGHHLGRVRRLRAGEIVTASTGDGWWRPYEIRSVDGASLLLCSLGEMRCEAAARPRLTIAAALITKARFDDAIVAMVELGVDRIVPLASERCVVRWDRAKAESARVRLAMMAREAAMQSRRSHFTEVCPLATPADLRDAAGLAVAMFGGTAANELITETGEGVIIATGPEGGFSRTDLAAFGTFQTINLGHHVLRAETASVAAVAIVRGGLVPMS